MIKLYTDISDVNLIELIDSFGMMRRKILARLGYRAKYGILYAKYTNKKSPTTIDYGGKTQAKDGRSLANYVVQRRPGNFMRLTSFPLNLFEYGRMLRSGRREPGRFIMRDKVRADLEPLVKPIADRTVDEVLSDQENA